MTYLLVLIVLFGVSSALAQERKLAAADSTRMEHTVYGYTVYGHIGAGAGGTGAGGIGMLRRRGIWALGFDLGLEGEREDLTGGRRTIETSGSGNILFGISPKWSVISPKWSVTLFGLLGARSHRTTCPSGQSYVGFRCYADTEPEEDYRVNYGGGIMMHRERITFGVRVTGQSQTAILGWNF